MGRHPCALASVVDAGPLGPRRGGARVSSEQGPGHDRGCSLRLCPLLRVHTGGIRRGGARHYSPPVLHGFGARRGGVWCVPCPPSLCALGGGWGRGGTRGGGGALAGRC